MFKMKCLSRTCAMFVWCSIGVFGFNLEIRNPVVKRGEVGSYFGYSVALHKSQDVNELKYSWLLVGAPLGQNKQPGTNRSGALWKCPIRNLAINNDKDCEQVGTDGYRLDFDYTEGTDVVSETMQPPGRDERKNGQWMGVSVKSQGPGEMVMVCAHRYTTTDDGHNKEFGLGLCYSLDHDLKWEDKYTPCSGRPMQMGHQQFGYCQAGTSLAFLKDGTVLIGSPGPYTWRGTMFVQSVGGDFLSRDTKVNYGPLNDQNYPIEKYSYLGMSVAAGRFINKSEVYYASGAPRGLHHGRVYIFNKTEESVEMNVVLIIEGEVIASNFGYEIQSVDLNNDGYDDLLVGAPFYFEKDKGGAVYIYYNLRDCTEKSCPYDLKLTGKFESRFGFAITALGDINKDGYVDVAIGAPYEGGGAIYIYLGSKDGLIKEPSQKIHPELDGLRTLGYSLSGGLDMDNNGYPDLLTGAFDSDMAILFRTRPIIDISIEVKGEELENIDITKKGCSTEVKSDYSCFSFEACFIIKDFEKQTNVDNVKVRSYIEADYKKSRKPARVWFKKAMEDKRHIFSERHVQLRRGKTKYCQEETVFINNATRDILNPIEFRVNYTLANNYDNSAVLNATSVMDFRATFKKDCGDDGECISSLQLSAGMNLHEISAGRYSLDLGIVDELNVAVNISNEEDAAYDAQLFITHPSSISYIALTDKLSNVKCTADNDTLVSCMLGNPFPSQKNVSLWFRFEAKPHKIRSEHELHFDIFVNSTSKDISNNKRAMFSTVIKKKAEVKIAGASTSFVIYGGDPKGESAMKYFDDIGSRVWHTYQVINEGPWEVSAMSVLINWPLQVASERAEGKWLLYLEDVPVVESLDKKSYCYVEGANVLNLTDRYENSDLVPDNLMAAPSFDRAFTFTPAPLRSRRRRDAEYIVSPEEVTGKDGKKRKIVRMDCRRNTAKCVEIRCDFRNVEKGYEATINIKSRLWNSTLIEDYNQVDYVQIYSHAQIILPPDTEVEQNVHDDFAQAETMAYPDVLNQADSGVSIWVYIIAALVGLLLLILLVLLLWKIGFFKRNRISDPTLSGNITKQSEAENLLAR